MSFSAEDYKRLTGSDQPPTFYTTPPEVTACKNYRTDCPTPCWHPHCDCQPAEEDLPDTWLEQYMASGKERQQRADNAAGGCLIAFIVIVILFIGATVHG